MAQARLAPDRLEDLVNRTRLAAPRSTPVSRPELAARVEAGAHAGLVLVSAPAGWGKTSLLTDWSRQSRLPVAWVSLTPHENDSVRFMRTLMATIEAVIPGELTDVRAMLRSSEPRPIEDVTTVLLESLQALEQPVAVVLDDFHVITHADVLAGAEHLIASASSPLTLVIATRVDPPWPLARLRASGRLAEIRTGDLRLTAPEASAMLSQLSLPEHAVAALVERTEGWAVGVQLAALAAARHTNPELMISNLRGTHRDIADYLIEQVLVAQPADVRDFLLTTSLLEQLSGSLCDALLGRTDSQAMLERLEAANLFLMPLDDERRWYRYHALFADLLRTHLGRRTDVDSRTFHRRAAAWLEQNAMLAEAVNHLLMAAAFPEAAALIDRTGETLLFSCGETSTLVQWIEALPREILPEYPRLLRYFAWGLTLTGRLEDAEALLAEVTVQSSADDGPQPHLLQAEVAAIRSRLASYRGDQELTIADGQEALALIGETRDRIAGDVSVSLGFAYRALGKTDEAAAAFARGAASGWSTGNLHAALWGTRYLALMRVVQGPLNDATAILDDEFARLSRESIAPGPAFAALLVGRAELRYERNDLDGALADLQQALALAMPAGDAKILMNIYVIKAMVHQALGRHEDATTTARRGQQVFGEQMPLAIPARIALLQGDVAAATRWADALGFAPDDLPDPTKGESEQITYGRVLLAQGKIDAGRAYLQRLLAAAERGGRAGNIIELLVILAAAHERAGETDGAVPLLARAVRQAAPEGYVRTFADEGPVLIPVFRALLRDRRHDEVPREYVNRLCDVIAGEPDAPISQPSPLPEPLTERELEVLRLMADGLPNRAIADRLFLAQGTIKAHVNHINGKLLARNRTEAVAQARRLRVI